MHLLWFVLLGESGDVSGLGDGDGGRGEVMVCSPSGREGVKGVVRFDCLTLEGVVLKGVGPEKGSGLGGVWIGSMLWGNNIKGIRLVLLEIITRTIIVIS